ncbi:hypothetical protein Taro_020863 [Colocasia esculenta]|uniref:Uncharacterized protein n=1 Tax=Colocasia esculenta TaxID=4460 RepID=A0A843V3N6_COLES|nr:hypothetical protein [Colocasia esculenta]
MDQRVVSGLPSRGPTSRPLDPPRHDPSISPRPPPQRDPALALPASHDCSLLGAPPARDRAPTPPVPTTHGPSTSPTPVPSPVPLGGLPPMTDTKPESSSVCSSPSQRRVKPPSASPTPTGSTSTATVPILGASPPVTLQLISAHDLHQELEELECLYVLMLTLLKKYEKERKAANVTMMAIVDGFQRAYSVDVGPINLLRAAAFHGAQYIAPLKRSIISYASGATRFTDQTVHIRPRWTRPTQIHGPGLRRGFVNACPGWENNPTVAWHSLRAGRGVRYPSEPAQIEKKKFPSRPPLLLHCKPELPSRQRPCSGEHSLLVSSSFPHSPDSVLGALPPPSPAGASYGQNLSAAEELEQAREEHAPMTSSRGNFSRNLKCEGKPPKARQPPLTQRQEGERQEYPERGPHIETKRGEGHPPPPCCSIQYIALALALAVAAATSVGLTTSLLKETLQLNHGSCRKL